MSYKGLPVLKIEKGIPIPSSRDREHNPKGFIPWTKMAVGDSVNLVFADYGIGEKRARQGFSCPVNCRKEIFDREGVVPKFQVQRTYKKQDCAIGDSNKLIPISMRIWRIK